MDNISCIICNSNNNTHFLDVKDRFRGESFVIVKCEECNFVFLSPRPTIDEISAYYDSNEYDPHNINENSLFNTSYRFVQQWALRWKLSCIRKFRLNGSLLDIGGGTGDFCSFMSHKGWDTLMQDSSNRACQIAESNGINTVKNIADINVKRPFDLITLWHSLEHIHDLPQLFNYISSLTCDDSFLAIAVPNLNAAEQKIYKEKWAPWDAPRHLYHFSIESITSLLNKNGWKIVSTHYMIQDTPYNILLSMERYNVISMIKAIITGFYSCIRILIDGVNSASSIMVICKKK